MRARPGSVCPLHRSRLVLGRAALSSAVLLLVVAGSIPVFAALEGAALLVARAQLLPSLLRLQGLAVVGGGTALFVFPLLVALTALFGRGYCSSLCPLGTLQDAAFALSRRLTRVRLRFRAPHTALRAVTFAIAVGAWLAGSMLPLSLLEPFSIVFRVLALTVGSLAPAHGLPGPTADPREAVQTFTSPVVYVAALSAALLVSVLAAATVRGRLFCNTLCPAGALLGVAGRFSLLRIRIAKERCTSCGLCERICPARCIDVSAARVYAGSCTLCFSCLEACPRGALRYGTRRAVS